MASSDIEQLGINVIRGLAMDAPQRANSGHPGTAMALAPLAHVLWTRVMHHDPSDPTWPDRDRFVLSAGHASILLYSMLYLTGYGLELEDIMQFRQWGSRTPGHPERGVVPGVEVTTGPLGQGFGNAVGMGLAERMLRARFGPDTVDHHVFVICSDGDLEEGLSHEAASLAGHLGLGRLVFVYDDNHISIDGATELAYSDDRARRFEAYGWHVQNLGEAANDTLLLEETLVQAIGEEDRPSLLILRSHIGWPSPRYTDTAHAHGDPLGEDEVRATKELLGLPPDEQFWVPEEVQAFYRQCVPRGQALRRAWEARQGDHQAEELGAAMAGHGLAGWAAKLPTFETGASLATRRAIATCMNATSALIPGLVSGSADLTGNTGTLLEGEARQSRSEPGGRQIAYGIREHAMGAALVGMAHHGGVLPVGGTFFVFSDYMRPSVRLAALSDAHVVYFWTHDSVGLGEDGPTHQPVEHLASLRAMPGLRVIRPADANETAQAWRIAVDRDGPTALVLSRQGVPVLAETAELGAGLARGAYTLVDPRREPDVILVGSGSEVHLCVEAAAQLAAGGTAARVVSFPCWELFEEQDEEYREQVLPKRAPRLSVEAGTSFGWSRWADEGIHLDRFGSSAPGKVNMERFGFTAAEVVRRARSLLTSVKGVGR